MERSSESIGYRIFDKYQKPVVSLAILGDDSPSWKPESYGWDLWGCRVGIEFPSVKLWEEYNERWPELEAAAADNPFAVAVMAHLKTKATRKDPQRRYREKYQLIRRLYESGYQRQEIREVLRFIDWLMWLPEELEEKLSKDLEPLEAEKKMQYVTSWERMALKKGLEQGIEKGLLRGKAAVLKRLIGRRFGEVPEWAERRMEEATSEELDLWSDRVLDAERLADVFAE